MPRKGARVAPWQRNKAAKKVEAQDARRTLGRPSSAFQGGVPRTKTSLTVLSLAESPTSLFRRRVGGHNPPSTRDEMPGHNLSGSSITPTSTARSGGKVATSHHIKRSFLPTIKPHRTAQILPQTKSLLLTDDNASINTKSTSSIESRVTRVTAQSSFSPSGDVLVATTPSVEVHASSSMVAVERSLGHDLQALKLLGCGSFGRVALVMHTPTKQMFAMKSILKTKCKSERHIRRAWSERAVLLGAKKCPFVCRLQATFQDQKSLIFLLEYCEGGELFHHLSKHRVFSEDSARFYASEVVVGIKFLHAHDTIYRDLKPENILLDMTGHVKLADFGLSRGGISAPDHGATSMCGTYEYLAPEVIQRSGHGKAVDWWALGMVIFEMLTGLPPWFTKDQQKLFASIVSSELVVPGTVSSRASSLIKGLLRKKPLERMGSLCGAVDIEEHPWFANSLNWKTVEQRGLSPPILPKKIQGVEASNFDTQFTSQTVTQKGLFHSLGSEEGHWADWDIVEFETSSCSAGAAGGDATAGPSRSTTSGTSTTESAATTVVG